MLLLLASLAQSAPVRILDDGPALDPAALEAPAAALSPTLGLTEPLALRHTETWRGRPMVQLQQLHQGVPVRGAGAVLKLDRQGRVEAITDATVPRPSVSTSPTLTPHDAAAIARRYGDPTADPTLEVLPGPLGGRLVYSARVFTTAPLSSWRVTVDANSGQVLERVALRREALGNIYEESPVFGEPVAVDIPALGDDGNRMRGEHAMVRSVVFVGDSPEYQYLARPDEAGDFLFDAAPDAADDPFVEVHTYVHVTRLVQHFQDTHGLDLGGLVQVLVNFQEAPGQDYSNAFMTFDPQGNTLLVFGQGYVDFAYDADVIAHEFGHAVIYGASIVELGSSTDDAYGRNPYPNALHEGLADYWSASWFGDAMVGEYYGGRDLVNDHTCPDDLVGESHEDGKIIGAAMWDMWLVLGAERSDAVVYGMLQQLSVGPTFAEVAEVTVGLVQDLVDDGQATPEELAQVRAAMDARGMSICARALPFSEEEPRKVVMPIFGRDVVMPDDQCQRVRDSGLTRALDFQYVFTTPPASAGTLRGVTVGMDLQLPGGGDFPEGALDYSVYLRKGELVTLDYDVVTSNRGDRLVPFAVGYDLAIEDMPSSIALEEGGAMPLEPDTEYYMGVVHLNCATADVELSLALDLEPLPEERPRGCAGCSHRAGGVGGALWMLLGLLLFRRRL